MASLRSGYWAARPEIFANEAKGEKTPAGYEVGCQKENVGKHHVKAQHLL